MAGLLPVYQTAYKVFCSSVHTGAHDLQLHLNSLDPSTLTEIRYGVSDDEIDHMLLVATEMMLHASIAVSERFGIPDAEAMQEIKKKHAELGSDISQTSLAV